MRKMSIVRKEKRAGKEKLQTIGEKWEKAIKNALNFAENIVK